MANPNLRALDRGAIEALALESGGGASRSLKNVWLPLTEEDGTVQTVIVCQLVFVRAGGFMILMPPTEEGRHFLETLGGPEDQELEEPPAFHTVRFLLVSNRGRSLGNVEGELVDVPWAGASCFAQSVPVRSAALRALEYVQWEHDGTSGRPDAASVRAVAHEWILQFMETEVAIEYQTATEGDQAGLAEEAAQPSIDGEPVDDDRLQLLARIAALEAQLNQGNRQSPVPKLPGAPQPSPAPAGRGRALFQEGLTTPQLTAQDWSRLQQLAGPAPTKQQASNRVTQLRPLVAQQEANYADIEKEAEDPASADLMLQALSTQAGDPLQQMMLIQLQQNSTLLKKLVGGKQTDPILGALSQGGDSGSGSSSGVKGCLARDAYLKTSADLIKMGEVIRANALQELSMQPSREHGGVMRRYVERRMPLLENKLLSHYACLIAEGWDIAYQSGNAEMIGFLGKMAMFTEQTALDQGRLQLSWLLTGFSEPNQAMLFSVKHTPGLKPFSRLAAPAWISANLAFLKDLDYAESRIQTLHKPKPKGSAEPADEKDKKPKPKNPKGKGKNKSGKSGSAEEPAGDS